MSKGNYKIEDLIYNLKRRGFTKTIDTSGSYQKGSDIYFKKVVDGHFIIFSHYNKGKRQHLQGFDCWEGGYRQGSSPVKGKPQAIDSISLSFDFEKGWSTVHSRIRTLEKQG